MTILKPDPQVVIIWSLLLVLGSIPLALGISFFLSGWIYRLMSLLWLVAFLVIYLYYLPRYYQNLIYIVDDDLVTLRRGVFYNKIYSLPIHRIQFTSLSSSPISKFFGLVTLQIVAPGARIVFPGLPLKIARETMKILEVPQEELSGKQNI